LFLLSTVREALLLTLVFSAQVLHDAQALEKRQRQTKFMRASEYLFMTSFHLNVAQTLLPSAALVSSLSGVGLKPRAPG
jgi:hypothetical protein